MPNVHVRCTVDNCSYWAQGNICDATEILITTDAVGERYPESLDASQLDVILSDVGQTPARSCLETSCKTFKAK